jgi:glycosyltransferase involved in cell wall biosynthesis
MAMGLPVVATNVDGCPELVVDGETGLLVPPADSVALENAICRLLMDNDLRAKMGLSSRKRVLNHFSQKGNISSFIELYERIGKKYRVT